MKRWILVIAASVAGCSSGTGTGSLGQECTYTSAGPNTLFGGTYSCNSGLLCNQAPQLNGKPVCQAPNSQGTGAACDEDPLCETALFCAPMVGGGTCQPLLQEGAPCPSGVGCAPNLQCVKTGTGNGAYCITAEDAGSEAGPTDAAGTADATAAGDAAQAAEGGEAGDAATAGDAVGLKDATPTGDATETGDASAASDASGANHASDATSPDDAGGTSDATSPDDASDASSPDDAGGASDGA